MANIKILMGLTNGEQKEFNRFNGLNSVESLSQSSPNSNDIYYGTLENSGTISIADENGVIKSMISNGEIDVSHPNIDIVVNNNKLQSHIGYDSSYADNDKILNVSLGNRLKDLDTLKYKGYVYPDESRSLATLLFDVLSGLKHTLFGTGQELTHEKFVDMLSDKYDENQTLYEYLENTVVEYPYIEANKTYREVIDYFCSVAQMQMFIDDDDNVKFVSARPRSFESLDNSIFIPRSNMFSGIEYDVILKNKYDGVETLKYDVENRVDYFTVVASPSINVDNLSVLEETENIDIDFGQGVGSTAYVGLVSITYLYVKSFYLIGDVTINKSDRQNLDKILKVFDNIKKDDSYTYNNTYNYMSGTATGIAKTSGGITVSNIVRNLNTSEAKTKNSQILTDDEVEYTFNYLTHKISSKSSLKDINQSCIYEIKYNNDDTITICFKILCGKLVTKLYGGSIWSDSQGLPVGSVTNYNLSVELSGTNEYFEPISVDVSVYGNKRTIVFNKVQYNTPNIESAKTKASINSNNLFQKDEIVDAVKANILTDYIKGVSNATVQVSCSDYYDKLGNKVINWSNGDVVRVNDIVCFQNDVYSGGNQRHWKVKGRNFTYDGVPMVNLELEEVDKFSQLSLESYSWEEIKRLSSSGMAEKFFKVGDEKTITLSNGEILTLQIAGFNYKEDFDAESDVLPNIYGIVFVTKNAVSGEYQMNDDFVGDWGTCSMRTKTLSNIFNMFPVDLKQSISEVANYIQTGIGLKFVYDNIWLLDYSDVFDDRYNLELFKDHNNIAKGYNWWLRPTTYDISYCDIVNEDGQYVATFGVTNKHKVIFGFCI